VSPDRDRPDRVQRIAVQPFGFVHINKCGGRSVESALGLPKFHADARRMIGIFGRETWDAMFTFAIVRNPYTRLASLYHHRQRKGLGGTEIGFADWIEAVFARADPRHALRPAMLRPCSDWLVDADGRRAVTEIVRLEELPARWPALCARLGVDVPLPHRNAGHGPWDCAQLYPPALRPLVEEVFATDFQAFDYAFPQEGR